MAIPADTIMPTERTWAVVLWLSIVRMVGR
jgi:hypothetical protein